MKKVLLSLFLLLSSYFTFAVEKNNEGIFNNQQDNSFPEFDSEIAEVLEEGGLPRISKRLLSQAVQGEYSSNYRTKDATNWIVFQRGNIKRTGIIIKQKEYRSKTASAITVTIFWFDSLKYPRLLQETEEDVELVEYAGSYDNIYAKSIWRNKILYLGRLATDSEVKALQSISFKSKGNQ